MAISRGRATGGDVRPVARVVILGDVEPDDGPEEEGPFSPWLPPDDRLWRHPSEVPAPGAPEPRPPDQGGAGHVNAPPASRFRSPATRLWTVAVVAGLIGASAASGIGMMTGAFQRETTVVHSVISTGSGSLQTLTSDATPAVDWSHIDDSIAQSVVEIDVSTPSGPASGSGFLFTSGDRESYVITDSPLVANANNIRVTFNAGDQYHAQLIGNDPISGVALISVPTWEHSFPLLGTVASLQIANELLAVGARTASGSVFEGSVTAEDRAVDVQGGATMQGLIAVSGPPLSSGAAGGPLVDANGEVVGVTLNLPPVNAADQNLTFAVPVDVAMHVVQQMLAGLSVTHPWLGVTSSSDITSAVAAQYGLPGGAQIEQVSPGSPASRLGLSPNDIITSFDRQPVISSGSLTQLLSQAQTGQRVMISYLHGGKSMQASVVVSNQPDND
jgi:S1-C subfamily serine protease